MGVALQWYLAYIQYIQCLSLGQMKQGRWFSIGIFSILGFRFMCVHHFRDT